MPRGCVFNTSFNKSRAFINFLFLSFYFLTFLNAQTDRRLNKIAIFTCRLISLAIYSKQEQQKIYNILNIKKRSFTKQSAILMFKY